MTSTVNRKILDKLAELPDDELTMELANLSLGRGAAGLNGHGLNTAVDPYSPNQEQTVHEQHK